ncbi:plasmid recombination protein [Hymenobacter sp. HSC-4F20]|uniref:MobV family relaxase n=1 Tax=Hymenobacter sp. HSC-4F20 TaxID=2864135 RepID=UPI001C729EB7|nr:MobV family relaxase [Hymenobacter sp. HSC-4F20]MBX0293122.1 plasmid recombination protein [Hymenobacter sp. HSC-4F20]
MAFAIIRVTKITSREQAISVAHHNYRTQETPNADPALRHLNHELVNHEQRSYWDLAGERIAELQLPRLRKDAVRAVEILLTASEEKFPKDPATGQRKDIRESQWVKDNLAFLQKRYGAENVIGCMLHQDESTPHLHAIVVPITQQQRLHEGERVGAKERLSARDLFSPVALRQLQTDYAQAMAPYGLKRGIEYSTAIHQDVRRFYGAQKTSQQELAELTKPLVHEPFQLPPLKAMDRVSPQAYLEREQARMNEHLARQVAAVNAKLEQVSIIATANTLAQDRVRVLEKQLATSKEHEQRLGTEVKSLQQQVTEKTEQVDGMTSRANRLAVQQAQGDPEGQTLIQYGRELRERVRVELCEQVALTLQKPMPTVKAFEQDLAEIGYTVRREAGQVYVVDTLTSARFKGEEVTPNGLPLAPQLRGAIDRTLAEQLQEERMKVAKDPLSLKATITVVDAEKAERIRAAFEEAGASVWQVRTLEDKRTSLSVAYPFDWKTIEQISKALEKAQRSEGVVVEESYGNQATRTGAVRTLERDRQPRERDQGISM